jgi:iron complex transport system substrate-binding protein
VRYVVVVAALLFAAGCGPSGSHGEITATSVAAAPRLDASTTTSIEMPPATTIDVADAPRVYVDERGVSVEVASVERIIPLDGDVAEIVFALGMGDQVVATDLSATYPPEADALPQIGYQRALNAEPILEFEPTLVIGTDIAGPAAVIDELERVGVPVAIVPTPDDATGPAVKIRAIAELLGVPERGDALASVVEADIARVASLDPAATPLGAPRIAMLYLRGEGTQLIFGDGTSIDWLIAGAGGVNVADEIGIVDTADITAEALLAAAPDVLLVTTDGLASVGGIDGLLALPSVAGTPAAAQRAVLAYDAQLMLGNGPRTGQFLATFVADLGELTIRIAAERADPDKENP